MSTVTKPILLNETGQEMVALLRQQTACLRSMSRANAAPAPSWAEVHDIVRDGLAPDTFHVGDQLTVTWRDVAADTTYEDVPLDVVAHSIVETRVGDHVPAMFLQWHYCSPFGVQFDHEENEAATESKFSTMYHYYKADNSVTSGFARLVAGQDYTVGAAIPTSETYYHSAIDDPTGYIVKYGYNRWSHSAIRQFLNSSAGVSAWWAPQHLGDVAPDEHTTKAGFMSGFDDDFLACLRPIKVVTALNTITDAGEGSSEDTFDTFFLPSLTQIYAQEQLTEGYPFEYWRQAIDSPTPNAWYTENANPAYVTYVLDNRTSAQTVRLRSAYRGYSYYTWYQYSGGGIGGYNARGAYRFAPVCAIC